MAANTGPLIVPPRPSGAPATTAVVTNDIHPVKPPVPIANPWLWLWWGLALALLAALAAGYVWWQRKKRSTPPPVPVIPPHVHAKQRLAQALRCLSDPRLFCIEVSDAVRVYLEERFEFHAPERTTDEFLIELQETQLLSPEQKGSLGEFLQSCDLVKFARFEPTEQALRELHESACRLVDETRFEPVSAPGAVERVPA